MMSDKAARENSVYVFRCGESGLYAFTDDRTGQILPSRIYPRIRWRLERCVSLRRDKKSPKREILKATLDAIKSRGFYLTHARAASLVESRAPISQSS
jgi:hypothetical protein